MGYASQYTGGDADSRKAEAARLVDMINELKEHLEPDCFGCVILKIGCYNAT